jgi:hypothetical protein
MIEMKENLKSIKSEESQKSVVQTLINQRFRQ